MHPSVFSIKKTVKYPNAQRHSLINILESAVIIVISPFDFTTLKKYQNEGSSLMDVDDVHRQSEIGCPTTRRFALPF